MPADSAKAQNAAENAAKNIKLIVCDVDGVLTDGGLYYTAEGMVMKRFQVHDGIGIKLAQAAGLEIAIVSGDPSELVRRRASVLGITECHLGPQRKTGCVDGIRERLGLGWEQVAFIGDDWIDIGAMRKVGLPIAVQNAQPEIKELALLVTDLEGGKGAVREAIRFILTAQGVYEKLREAWLE